MASTPSRIRRASQSVLSSAIARPIEALESRVLFNAGMLDTTFNGTGKRTTDYRNTDDGIDVVFQSDGKAVVVGDTQATNETKDAFISRYNVDGSVDTSFGTNGASFLDLGADEIATGVALQSDGKFVVCGLTGNLSGQQGDFFIARYTSAGMLDSTFNASGVKPGVKTIDFGGLDGAADLAITSTGRIIVVGATAQLSGLSGGGIAIAFLNPDGSFDTSVGGGVGHTFTTPTGAIEGATSIALGAGGHFYVSGFSYGFGIGGSGGSRFLVAEFNADGTLTTSFGSAGRAFATFQPQGFTPTVNLAVGVAYNASNGKIAAAGATADGLIDTTPGLATSVPGSHATHADFAVAQFNANGTPDTTFGGGGTVTVDFDGGNLDGASDVLYQPDNKIVASGGSEDTGTGQSDFATARFALNGALDTTFGPSGQGAITTDFGASDGAFGMELQSDNKIYEVGHTKANAGNGDVAIVRYTPDGSIVVGPPVLSIDNISITEGNSGNTTGSFTVTLNGSATGTVMVSFTTAEGTATIADNDYGISTGTLTFAPGETTKTIPVTVFGDTKIEADETFFVKLSSPTGGATISSATGTATIINDDNSVANNNALKITSIVNGKFPSPLIGGQKTATGTATVTLMNSGKAALKGTVIVNVYASLDKSFSKSADKLVGSQKVTLSPLAAGKSTSTKVKITIPAFATDSTVFLLATASGAGVSNSNNSVVSSNTSLNVVRPSVMLIGKSGSHPAINVKAGTKATVAFPLTNTGSAAASGNINFDVILTADGTTATTSYFFFNDKTTMTQTATLNIPAAKTVPVSFKISLPPATGNGVNHLGPGSYVLLIRIHKSKFNPANTTDGSTIATIPFIVT